MAIDEAILWAVAEGKSPPTLRFYGWEPPCLSIGYSQSMEGEVDVDKCREVGVDFVRRPTGGRAILHADELTYSVVASQSEPRVAGGVIESYRRLSAGLVAGLRGLGVEASQALAPREARVQGCGGAGEHTRCSPTTPLLCSPAPLLLGSGGVGVRAW